MKATEETYRALQDLLLRYRHDRTPKREALEAAVAMLRREFDVKRNKRAIAQYDLDHFGPWPRTKDQMQTLVSQVSHLCDWRDMAAIKGALQSAIDRLGREEMSKYEAALMEDEDGT